MARLYVYLSFLVLATATVVGQQTKPLEEQSDSESSASEMNLKPNSSLNATRKFSPESQSQNVTFQQAKDKPDSLKRTQDTASNKSSILGGRLNSSSRINAQPSQNNSLKTGKHKFPKVTLERTQDNRTRFRKRRLNTIYVNNTNPSQNNSLETGKHKLPKDNRTSFSGRSFLFSYKKFTRWQSKNKKANKRRGGRVHKQAIQQTLKDNKRRMSRVHTQALKRAVELFAQEYSKKQGRPFLFVSVGNVTSGCKSEKGNQACRMGVFDIKLVGARKKNSQTKGSLHSAAKKAVQKPNRAGKKVGKITQRAVKEDDQNGAVYEDDRFASLRSAAKKAVQKPNRASKEDGEITQRAVKEDDQNGAVNEDDRFASLRSAAKKAVQKPNRAGKKDGKTTQRAVKEDDQNGAVDEDDRFASVVHCRKVVYKVRNVMHPDITTYIVNHGVCVEQVSPYELANFAAKIYAETYDKHSKANLIYVFDVEDMTYEGIVGSKWISFGVKLLVKGKDGEESLVRCRGIVGVIPINRGKGPVEFKKRGTCEIAALAPSDLQILKLMHGADKNVSLA